MWIKFQFANIIPIYLSFATFSSDLLRIFMQYYDLLFQLYSGMSPCGLNWLTDAHHMQASIVLWEANKL
jgi:hypothetical protein